MKRDSTKDQSPRLLLHDLSFVSTSSDDALQSSILVMRHAQDGKYRSMPLILGPMSYSLMDLQNSASRLQ